MTLVLIILLVLGLLFSFVVFFGPPYVPTLRRNLDVALNLLELKPGQTMLDLGSGDGRVLIAAAKRGVNVVGIELSPVLFVVSWLRTRRYRKRVRIILGNYFAVKWPEADAIFTFMIPRQMAELDRRVETWRVGRPIRLASYGFRIPGKKAVKSSSGVFLYHYLRRPSPSVTMSSMKTNRQAGYVSGILLSLITCTVLLVGAVSFGVWAFMSRQDYKNNSDQKAAKAAAEAKKATEAADAVKYAEAAKNPLVTHRGPDAFGAITVKYPKTWSGYVLEGGQGSDPVNDFFHPKVVPNTSNRDNTFALRIQVVDRSYETVLRSYESAINAKRLTASPYKLPKVKGVVGTRLDGQVELKKQGRLVILPMRNMTLKIWTESSRYLPDFNKIILPNVMFSP